MCNLNILVKKKVSEEIATAVLMAATSVSFITNPEGDGAYFSGTDKLIKKFGDKVNINKYKEDIDKSRFIITHQRIATSGKTEEYVQPFRKKGFILAHNGVMNDFVKTQGHSDTHGFFCDFIKLFKKYKGELSRTDAVVKVMKELLEGQYGSYSIALFDRKEQAMYYFKDGYTKMNILQFENALFMTTNEDNLVFGKFISEKAQEIIATAGKIYKIDFDEKGEISAKAVGEIKEYVGTTIYPKRDYGQTGWWERDCSHGNYQDDDYDTLYSEELEKRKGLTGYIPSTRDEEEEISKCNQERIEELADRGCSDEDVVVINGIVYESRQARLNREKLDAIEKEMIEYQRDEAEI